MSKKTFRWASVPDGYVEDDVPKVPATQSRTTSMPAYSPVAATLVLSHDALLTQDQGYDIKFSAGMMEGTGLVVSEDGGEVTVSRAGSYRFEVCGSALTFSDVGARLLFHSDTLPDDMQPFAATTLTSTEGAYSLRGISTILALEAGQVIQTRLVPEQAESVIVHSGLRWMIHRVA